MSDTENLQQNKVPGWFLIVGIVALIWNLLGVMAFAMQMSLTPEMLAQLPEAERALYENMPGWVNIVFAIAVFGGTLASIGLLMRKSWALLLFVISLAAVIIQDCYSIFMTNSFEVLGQSAVVMTAVVFIIAVVLVLFARSMKVRNILQ